MNKVLVAIDGSEASDHAVDFAISMARNSDARLIVLNVVQETTIVPVPMGVVAEVEGVYVANREALESAASDLTARAVERAETAGLADVERIVRFGSPARVIVDTANDEDVDVIVMGRRGLSEHPHRPMAAVAGLSEGRIQRGSR